MQVLPLEARHTALGARFGEFAGWNMPLWYSGALDEHLAVRNAAGLFDISHMGRFRLQGSDAASLLSSAFSRDASQMEPGQSVYALACNDTGGIIDDLIVYKLEDEAFLVICNAANAERIGAIMTAKLTPSVSLTDLQAASVLLAVQGPRARAITSQILDASLLDLPRHGFCDLEIGFHIYFCSRSGYTGEDGFEIMCSIMAGEVLFDRLIDAGVLPCGLAARDSLRLEAALPLHGSDIDETTSPWEAGLGWAVDLEHDFAGRDAVAALKPSASKRLACLVSDGQGIFRHGHTVLNGDTPIATVTSGGFSPMLDRSIALAYLPRVQAREGTALNVDVRGRRVDAHTVKRPFYSSPDLAQNRAE